MKAPGFVKNVRAAQVSVPANQQLSNEVHKSGSIPRRESALELLSVLLEQSSLSLTATPLIPAQQLLTLPLLHTQRGWEYSAYFGPGIQLFTVISSRPERTTGG